MSCSRMRPRRGESIVDPQNQALPPSFLASDGPQSYTYRKETASYHIPTSLLKKVWQSHLYTVLQNKWKQSI